MPRPLEYPCCFDPVEHVYRDVHGRAHRSITQILTEEGLCDFSMVPPEILFAAADRGTRVHEITALWDRMRGLMTVRQFVHNCHIDEDIQDHIIQYERFLVETGFVADISETERPRLVDIHGTIVGMTPDRVGRFPRLKRPSELSTATCVVDIKTGIVLPSHPLQIAGYSMGLEKVLRLCMLHERYALYLQPDKYRLVRHPHQQDFYAMLDAIQGGGNYLNQWKNNQQRKLSA